MILGKIVLYILGLSETKIKIVPTKMDICSF